MSTSVWARLSDDVDPDVRLGNEVGYRCGAGPSRTAFQWLVTPSQMEQWTAFEDDYGRIYDRAEFMEFVRACDEEHERGCYCNPVRHPPGMWNHLEESRDV